MPSTSRKATRSLSDCVSAKRPVHRTFMWSIRCTGASVAGSTWRSPKARTMHCGRTGIGHRHDVCPVSWTRYLQHCLQTSTSGSRDNNCGTLGLPRRTFGKQITREGPERATSGSTIASLAALGSPSPVWSSEHPGIRQIRDTIGCLLPETQHFVVTERARSEKSMFWSDLRAWAK